MQSLAPVGHEHAAADFSHPLPDFFDSVGHQSLHAGQRLRIVVR
jgi:hypothetical protein